MTHVIAEMIVPFLTWLLLQYLKKNDNTAAWAQKHMPGILTVASLVIGTIQTIWEAVAAGLPGPQAHGPFLLTAAAPFDSVSVGTIVKEIIVNTAQNWAGTNLFDNIVRKGIFGWLIQRVLLRRS